MVGSAKKKVEEIEEQLHRARVDYEATKDSADKAQQVPSQLENNFL